MIAYFITYNQNGVVSNALVSGEINPYKWLVESRKKYSDSAIALLNCEKINIDIHEFNLHQSVINIDYDNAKRNTKPVDKKAEIADNKAEVESLPPNPENVIVELPETVEGKKAGRPKKAK
jgi:hypothetical protein